jgi:16S rRNA (adenine1518-N6/adenine1519-N6)-dimethyltransferase
MYATPYAPRKSLGQHFLHDGNIARKIVAELNPQPGDHVVEIGPGPGVLTALLAEMDIHLTAIEVDIRAVEELRSRFPAKQFPQLELLHHDVLKVDFTALATEPNKKLRIIGNLPYNITSQILFRAFEHSAVISDVVVMMQKEVADRIVSPPGGKEYGILSVFTQTHGEVRRCFHVSPNVFIPRPKVWSSVIHLSLNDIRLADIKNYSFFRRLVKATFGQRRKTLSNSLRNMGIEKAHIPPAMADVVKLRPEQLSVEDFITLSNNLQMHV